MRELKTIELPVSKMKVEIITHLTLDEYMQLDETEYKGARNVRMDEHGRPVTEINGQAIVDREKLIIKLAVKTMTDAEGAELPVTYETIGGLHITDGLALIKEVNAIEGYTKKK